MQYELVAGIVILALVFAAAAIYYISRVRSRFASVPRLERPWLLLEVGAAMLSLALLSIGITPFVGISSDIWSAFHSAVLILSTVFFLAAMVLMKRAWTLTESD